MTNSASDSILLAEIASYYSQKLTEHGANSKGVDWNSQHSQNIRFEQLCKLINFGDSTFSVNDLGCGYGALVDYLKSRHKTLTYHGFDISREMIKAAEQKFLEDDRVKFFTSSEPCLHADYGVASGIFNVRLDCTDDEWFRYLKTTLDALDRTSRLGFAFNCLTSYSDEDKKRDYLYYSNPCELFDLCKRCYSREVALLHDYGLYEYTILVRKSHG
jgi:SAM-dependent methyltransferase